MPSTQPIIMSPEDLALAVVAPAPPPSDDAPLTSSATQQQTILTSLPSNPAVVVPPPPAPTTVTAAPPSPPLSVDDAPLEEEIAPNNNNNAPSVDAQAAGVAGGDTSSTAPQSTSSPEGGAAHYQPSSPSQQRSRRSTANYHQDYSAKGIFTSEEADEEAAEGGIDDESVDDANLRSSLLEKNGVIISMKDPNYKAIMFSAFRKLGAIPTHQRDDETERRVKEETFHLIKNYSGGSFMHYVDWRYPDEGITEVDEKTARTKIFADIRNRLESKSHWAEEDSSNDIDIILSLRDPNYKHVIFTANQKLGTHPNRDNNEEMRVKEEVFNMLKISGGRFMCYRNGKRPQEGLIEVDEKTARKKIMADISRRKESESHWNGVDLTSDISLSLQEQEKEAAVEEEEEEANLGSDDDDGSDYEDDSNSSQSVQTSSGDIILSLRDANYKSIMFSFFRQLGTRQYLDEVSDEEKRVKEEVFNIFQSSGGRLMRHRDGRRPKEGLFEVDEKTAREKIMADISRRMESKSHWAEREGASTKQSATKKVSGKKRANNGAAVNGGDRSSRPRVDDKIVGIRKSYTKYSLPTKRVSPYPKRSKARVTFKDDEQYSVQNTPLAKAKRGRSAARLSELYSDEDDDALDAESSADVAITETPSRDYRCGVCGQPKKGHKCTGDPSSWVESSTAVVQTPTRARSKSRPGLSAKSPKFITPTPKEEDCGECAMCMDKIKFGGPGTKRQKCEKKRCIGIGDDNFQFTSPPTTTRSTRSGTKRKSAVAANLTIMNVMADEDMENKVPSGEYGDEGLAESQLLVKRAKFASDEEKMQMPSFEEVSASEFNELIDLLQSSPLPQRNGSGTDVDWQGLHLADLSPIPVLPITRLAKLDTSKPIILGPNSAWSQRVIMTEEVTTSSSLRGKPIPRAFKSNLRVPILEPKTSETQQFESIMSPNFGDGYVSIFSEDPKPKLIPYSPIKLLHRHSSLS